MASGKPIISNLVMGYDIINKYHCGISRNMNSAEEYADLLLSLSKLEAKEYGEMCENARRGAKDYNYITLTDKIIDIIQKAVRK